MPGADSRIPPFGRFLPVPCAPSLHEFLRACEVLGIKKVDVTYPGSLKKVGIGRVIDGAKAIDKLAGGPKP